MKPTVTYFDQKSANDAFAVLRALETQEREDPALAASPLWQALRQKARDRFANSFKGDSDGAS